MAATGDSRSANGAPRAVSAGLADWAPTLAFLVIAGVVLGLFGPFGTYQSLDPATRVAFWTGAVLAIGGMTIAIHRAIAARLGRRLGWLGTVALTSVVAAVPGSLLIAAIGLYVLPGGVALSAPMLVAQVLLVNLSLTTLGTLLWRRRAARIAPAPSPESAAARPGRFGERLPPELRAAAILALEAEDHYLRVHTSAGSTLILLRLGDAVAELGPEAGAQVHRSWWVARDAVARIERAGEKVALVLPGDLRVPVSRGNRAKLAAMGWS